MSDGVVGETKWLNNVDVGGMFGHLDNCGSFTSYNATSSSIVGTRGANNLNVNITTGSNNEEYAVETLDVNKVIKVNETNVVRIENGKVFMESAECPDQICVKQKPLNLSGRDIVCLPNKVTVRVVSENKDVDVVTR